LFTTYSHIFKLYRTGSSSIILKKFFAPKKKKEGRGR